MPEPDVGRSSKRRAGLVGWAFVLVLTGLAGGWALRTMLAPAPDVLEATGYTLVSAERGEVSQLLRLNTAARWPADMIMPNRAAGTLTSIDLKAGSEVEPGDRLYTVDLGPVVVAEGDVPAFRGLSRGDEGSDVAQLQNLLTDLEYYTGEASGRFGEGLYWAVREWQQDLGIEDDGVVRLGDVVFVPDLPAPLALAPELAVGTALTGGEPALQVLPEAPEFTIALPEGQARIVTPRMAVEIDWDNGEPWSAEVVDVQQQDTAEGGGFVATLEGVNGEPVCGDECDEVPLGEATLIPSLIEVVPELRGVTVPAAAIVTTAAGETGVVLENGDFRPVTMAASASGMAVVEGVRAGERVRTPGNPPAETDRDGR